MLFTTVEETARDSSTQVIRVFIHSMPICVVVPSLFVLDIISSTLLCSTLPFALLLTSLSCSSTLTSCIISPPCQVPRAQYASPSQITDIPETCCTFVPDSLVLGFLFHHGSMYLTIQVQLALDWLPLVRSS